MGFIKVVKNSAYYSRYQVKFRRRREGKTDYYARKRLVVQDKNKYACPKYRLVVRFTNRDVICQLAFSTIKGDRILASAYGHELAQHGMPVRTTNYAAAYAVGLLLARRHLTKFGLNELWQPNTDLGAEYHPARLGEDQAFRRPFKAMLDVGLRRTTTGARLFAAVKGAADGGLNVPHSTRRFIGTDNKNKANPELLRSYILGGHVANWMRICQKKDNGSYEKLFSSYIKAGLSADDLEAKWQAVHDSIRKNPVRVSSRKTLPAGVEPKDYSTKRSTLAERKARIAAKIAERDAAKA